MPNRGDKMYRIQWVNGANPMQTIAVLETAMFIEEGLSDPGCTVTTYLLRDSERRFRCSKEMYVTTPKAAWERHLAQCKESLPTTRKNVEDAIEQLKWVENEIKRVMEVIKYQFGDRPPID